MEVNQFINKLLKKSQGIKFYQEMKKKAIAFMIVEMFVINMILCFFKINLEWHMIISIPLSVILLLLVAYFYYKRYEETFTIKKVKDKRLIKKELMKKKKFTIDTLDLLIEIISEDYLFYQKEMNWFEFFLNFILTIGCCVFSIKHITKENLTILFIIINIIFVMIIVKFIFQAISWMIYHIILDNGFIENCMPRLLKELKFECYKGK